jgi:hypothetical protein
MGCLFALMAGASLFQSHRIAARRQTLRGSHPSSATETPGWRSVMA